MSELDQIRDQQQATWDKFSAGWKRWDTLVLNWLAPVHDHGIARAAAGRARTVPLCRARLHDGRLRARPASRT